MVLFGQCGCFRKNGFSRTKVAKVVVFGQSGCNRAKLFFFCGKVVVIGQKWLCSNKIYCIRSKWLYMGKSGFNRAKVVVFG